MSWIDPLLILIIIIAGYIGYRRAFYKELYNLICCLIAFLIGFSFKKIIGTILINKINFGTFKQEMIFIYFKDTIINMAGLLVGYLLGLIIVKIIVYILTDKDVIPDDENYFRYGGALINGLESILFLTVLSFIFSFGPYLEFNYYKQSLLLKPFYHLNVPLYRYGEKLHTIIDNGLALSQDMDKYKDDPTLFLADTKAAETIKLLFQTGILTEDLIIKSSKDFFAENDPKEIDFGSLDFTQIKEEPDFKMFRDLYKEGILTERLLTRLKTENNLANLDVDALIDALKE